MATIIDELVLLIGLDPKNFRAGRKDLEEEFGRAERALGQFGRDVEQRGEKISEIFGLTKRGVAGLLATFVGAEGAAFVDRVATMDAHTQRLAHSIGTSTRELSIWQNMVRQVGGTAEDANATFGSLNDTFQGMVMGNQMPSPGFASLLSRAGVNWQSGTPDQALQRIMTFLQGQPEKQQRFWLSQIPGMNENMMFLMLEGIKNMARFRDEVQKIGVASDHSGDQARDLQEKTAQLTTAWEAFARVLFPALTFILNVTTGLFGLIEKISGALGLSSVISGKVGAGVIGGGAVGAGLGSVIPGVGTVFGGIAGGIAGGFAAYGAGGAGGAAASTPTSGAALSRGDRNNNPGNIEYGPWAVAHGAVGTDGRFAIFPDFHTGAAAMAQLLHDRYQGLTLSQIQQRWVGNADSSYLGQMMKATGLGAGDRPNLNDPNVVANLISGMMTGEGTHHVIRGTQDKQAPSKQTTVHVGEINVQSNNADPKKVADAIPASIQRQSALAGINTGLV